MITEHENSFRQRFQFPKTRRLLRRKEFLLVQRRGKRYNIGPIIACVRFVSEAPSRVGITTSKRVGRAYVRTRIRRLIREAARRIFLPAFPVGIEIVFIAKNGLSTDLPQDAVDEAVMQVVELLQKRQKKHTPSHKTNE